MAATRRPLAGLTRRNLARELGSSSPSCWHWSTSPGAPRGEAVTDLDVTGAEAFEGLRRWLHERDVTLSMSRVRPQVRRRFEHFGLLVGVLVHPTNRAAVAALTDAAAAAAAHDEEDPHGRGHR